MVNEDKVDLQNKCRDRQFYAYGTARIFERRARRYGDRRTLITYFGIIIPIVVGATVMAFGAGLTWFSKLLFLAAILAIVQLVASVWSVVARWDERCSEAIDSSRANTRLYNLWKKLTDHPSTLKDDEFEKALSLDSEQEQKDLALSISDKEKRYAMREALFYFGKPCPSCGEVPRKKKPLNCYMCGNY